MSRRIQKAKGKKFDGEKVPLQLIPGNALLEVGKVLGHGAKKYEAHNWRAGLAYDRLIGACFRHLVAFNEGEDLDPETHLSHVAHLACEALFLLEFVTKNREDLDSRYDGGAPRAPLPEAKRVPRGAARARAHMDSGASPLPRHSLRRKGKKAESRRSTRKRRTS